MKPPRKTPSRLWMTMSKRVVTCSIRRMSMSGGVAEQIVGKWFASRPKDITDRVLLATKGRFGSDKDPNGVGLSRRHLHRALDASLDRLGVDTVDLYQLHASDMLTPVEETLSFLGDAIRAGKIHYIGISNFHGMATPADCVDGQGHGCPSSGQPPATVQPPVARKRVRDGPGCHLQ